MSEQPDTASPAADDTLSEDLTDVTPLPYPDGDDDAQDDGDTDEPEAADAHV